MVHPSENEVSKINFIYIDLFFFFFFFFGGGGGLLELAAFEIKCSLHLQSPKFTISSVVTIIFTKLKLVSGVVNILLFPQSAKPGLKQEKSPVPGPY